jgi:pSer/pThr/pTyr-binding forkhead associated (FHA) protein
MVSRNHPCISFQNGEHSIEDLRSANATYVSGKKVTRQVLRNEDEIDIVGGKMLFYEGSS